MQQKLTLILGLMLFGAQIVAAADKPASGNLAAPWESSVKALSAGAYTTQAIRQLGGATAWKAYRDNPVVKLARSASGTPAPWDR